METTLTRHLSFDSSLSQGGKMKTLAEALNELLDQFPTPPLKPRVTGNALVSGRASLRKVGHPLRQSITGLFETEGLTGSRSPSASYEKLPGFGLDATRESRAMTMPSPLASPISGSPSSPTAPIFSYQPQRKQGLLPSASQDVVRASPKEPVSSTLSSPGFRIQSPANRRTADPDLEHPQQNQLSQSPNASPVSPSTSRSSLPSSPVQVIDSKALQSSPSSELPRDLANSSSGSTLSPRSARSPSIAAKSSRASTYIGGEQATKLKNEIGDRFDERNFDLLLRAFKGLNITQKEHQELNYLLRELDRREVIDALERAQRIVLELATANNTKKSRLSKVMTSVRGGREESIVLKASRLFIEYQEGPVPVNKPLTQEITLTNMGNEKIKYRIHPGAPTKRYEFSFTPKEGEIKKKSSQTISIQMVVRSTTQVNHVFVLEVEEGPRYYFVIRAESEKSVFGVDVFELDTAYDAGLLIPSVLVTMKNYLYENGGLSEEGIFRQAGDEKEELLIKDQLNRGTFCGCKDVRCVANLIKVWYRELPELVLNILPPTTLMNDCEDLQGCLNVLNNMPEPNKSLVKWILELLTDVSIQEQQNKMGPRNLAIVIAPNLLSLDDFEPQQSLTMSQKVVQFVHQLILNRKEEKCNSK